MVRLRSLPALGLLVAATVVVCPAQLLQTDSTTAAASVVTLTGQVSVLRDSQPWALEVGSQVNPQQVILTGPDGYALFRIADGSTFEVFPNSRVTFRSHPGDWRDLLEMWLGRVKVQIQKFNGQPNHNRVRTPTAIISVRGTVFDVSIEEEDATLVLVEEGQVAVQHALQAGEARLLNPGEWIRVYRNVPLAQKRLDKGSIIGAALRAATDAIYTAVYRTPRGSSGPAPSGGGGTPLPGDRGGTKPPPAPPPSTPPPSGPPSDAGAGAPPPPTP